jgi:hypothetical protein
MSTNLIKTHFLKELNLNGSYKVGDQNPEIKKIQEWLNLWSIQSPSVYSPVKVDSLFGKKTDKAIRTFQTSMHLKVDGIAGPITFGALTTPLKKAYTMSPPLNLTLKEHMLYFGTQHVQNTPRELNQNEGPWVRSYMDGLDGKEEKWCMGFVQTILDMAATALNEKYTDILKRSVSCIDIFKFANEHDMLIPFDELRKNPNNVQPGDIFLLYRPQEGAWGHTGIIEKMNPAEGTMNTIEGNSNPTDPGTNGIGAFKKTRNFLQEKICAVVMP